MDGEVQLAEDGGEVGEDECRYPHDHHGPGLQGPSVCWALGRALTHPWLRATMFSVTRSNCYLSVLLMVTDGSDKRVLFSLGISSDYFVFILWVV